MDWAHDESQTRQFACGLGFFIPLVPPASCGTGPAAVPVPRFDNS
ncbi:hypothetical protein RA8CHR_00904 [Variovorax sp. RA8]|nr:hypothetical protein RA8CHR_00904 [Variovorax sp. RA8]